jgi:hypothetical protein
MTSPMSHSARITRFRRSAIAAALAVVSTTVISPRPAEAAWGTIPAVNGYTITSKQVMSSSLIYAQYRSSNPRRVINVAFVKKGSHYRTVVSNDRIAGPNPRTETVSSMCKRVGCKIAVNGDFFSTTTGQPAGGMAYDGYPQRTPPDARYHFFADWAGNVGVKKITMPIRLYATYPNGQRPVYVHSMNTARASERAVLYNRAWGYSSETTTSGFELTLKILNQPTKMDQPVKVRMIGGRWGTNTSIPIDGMVLSGHGGNASAIAAIWNDVVAKRIPADAEMSIDIQPNLRMFVGGTPALLQAGKQAFTNDGSSFMTKRDPKTMVGRDWDGNAVLAVVDGRQSDWSVGMSMTEAMQFMRSMRCSDALNLDGGGSSEFVKNGVVINKPSDGRERSIAAALTVVP